jgi:acetyl esterase/lipase
MSLRRNIVKQRTLIAPTLAAIIFITAIFFSGLAAAIGSPESSSQNGVVLWPEGAPGAVGNEDADRPTLDVYLPPPEKATGTAVVICPGGGYIQLDMVHEGKEMAQWFNTLGVAAFVLKYRVGPRYHYPAMFQDAQRALRYVRTKAGEFGVTANQIGIIGFSAGGHLASTAATHFDPGNPAAADPIERASSRPDFLILGYPVISFTSEYTHRGSRYMVLGPNPDPKLARSLSNELQVTAQTPPTFLFHMADDKVVPAENSVLFYMALLKAGVPAELHIYEQGKHGCALALTDPVLSSWTKRLADWMKVRKLLKRTNPDKGLQAGIKN